MKKALQVFLVFILIAAFLNGCNKVDEQVTACISDIKSGLESRWAFTNKDYNSYEEHRENVQQGIDAELSKIEKYVDVEFKDDKFDAIIEEYINALNSQKAGIEYKFSDTKKYNELYIENGLVPRKDCLNELKNKYGLSVDEDFQDNFDSVLNGNYTTLVAPNEQVKFETEYGKLGIKFLGFESLVNPSDEKELVIYCEIENFSYYDEWNGESLLFDYFMGVYDGANYNIEFKSSAHDYIDGYKECMGFADLKRGEKGKFAILLEYSKEIDIIYISFGGTEKSYGCYLTSTDRNDNSLGNNDSQNDETNNQDNSSQNLWTYNYYVDYQFGEKTDDWYISTYDSIEGTFENSATTNSKLLVDVLYDYNDEISIFLYEYADEDNLVKNSSSQYKDYYKFVLKNDEGKTIEARGQMHPGGDRIYIIDKYHSSVLNLLKTSKTIKFYIEFEDSPTTRYRFEIYMNNFNDIVDEMIKDSGDSGQNVSGNNPPQFIAPSLNSSKYALFFDIGESDTIYITIDNGSLEEWSLTATIEDSSVADYNWGDWNGNTIPITITALDSGETGLKVCIDGYEETTTLYIGLVVYD